MLYMLNKTGLIKWANIIAYQSKFLDNSGCSSSIKSWTLFSSLDNYYSKIHVILDLFLEDMHKILCCKASKLIIGPSSLFFQLFHYSITIILVFM